jgi:hypothetical protein
MHPNHSVESLERGFLCFGGQQSKGEDFRGIEECVHMWNHDSISLTCYVSKPGSLFQAFTSVLCVAIEVTQDIGYVHLKRVRLHYPADQEQWRVGLLWD